MKTSPLTIHEIDDRIRQVFPELKIVRCSDKGSPKFRLICLQTYQSLAYTYYKKWILTPSISMYSHHISAIISLLERWDGE